MKVQVNEIDAVCDLVLDLCGVDLDSSKAYLIDSRLGPIVKRHGYQSYSELVQRIRRTANRELKDEVIDAITTHETLFFRDHTPFEAFRHKALPNLLDHKRHTPFPKRIRIWSAACSTGQEPYSIAISICELIPDAETWDIQILGTDISDAAVAKASRGRYTASEIGRGIPNHYLNRYFNRTGTESIISDRIRSMVTFRTLNLQDSFTLLGQFDFIFCRNVAIYFRPEMRKSLFERLTKSLLPYGCLFVGASEILSPFGPQFVPLHHCGGVYYQPNSVPVGS